MARLGNAISIRQVEVANSRIEEGKSPSTVDERGDSVACDSDDEVDDQTDTMERDNEHKSINDDDEVEHIDKTEKGEETIIMAKKGRTRKHFTK
ncbi:MAG: hypothetical protein ACREBR_03810 [bacterium]